jgi:hypothetical protein
MGGASLVQHRRITDTCPEKHNKNKNKTSKTKSTNNKKLKVTRGCLPHVLSLQSSARLSMIGELHDPNGMQQ